MSSWLASKVRQPYPRGEAGRSIAEADLVIACYDYSLGIAGQVPRIVSPVRQSLSG
jgi:hypothetical protein